MKDIDQMNWFDSSLLDQSCVCSDIARFENRLSGSEEKFSEGPDKDSSEIEVCSSSDESLSGPTKNMWGPDKWHL